MSLEKILEHPWVKEYKHDLDQFRQLDIIEEKTGVDRLYVVTGVIVCLFFALLGAFGGSPVANLVGFVFPTYKSYKALKSVDKDDDTQWLTYWVVYAFFIVIEGFTDIFISWIPFYHIAKIGFLYFCMSPTFQGSSLIFKRFIEPFLDSTSETLDEMGEDVRDAVEDIAEDIQEEIKEKGTAMMVNHVMNQATAGSRQPPKSRTSTRTSNASSEGESDDEYVASTRQDPPTMSDSEDTYHPKSN